MSIDIKIYLCVNKGPGPKMGTKSSRGMSAHDEMREEEKERGIDCGCIVMSKNKVN